jgi:hypothetical protein
MSLINWFISEQGKILSRQINRLTLKQQWFIRKERKLEKGHQLFYLSKEHYQQRFYMDPFAAASALVMGPLRRNPHGPFIAATVRAPLRSKEHRQESAPSSPCHAASPPPHRWTPAPAWTLPPLQPSISEPPPLAGVDVCQLRPENLGCSKLKLTSNIL